MARSGKDRRQHARYRLVLRGSGQRLSIPVRRVGRKGAFEVASSDVSLGGMRVYFNEPVRPGDTVRMRFPVRGKGKAVLDAVVRWIRKDSDASFGSITAGLAFQEDVPKRWIEALMQVADRREEGDEKEELQVVTRQVNLPFKRAIEISLRSLKIRFWRSLVTSIVVFLAIAFLVYMLSVEPVTARLEVGEVIQRAAKSQRIWVALVSMLVAAVGITNTLHMSVAERYREIGTMKCLGALDRFVVELFMLESLAMGAIGSAAGSILGTLLATGPWLLRSKDLAQVTLPLDVLGTNFLVGIGVGMLLTLFGALYPAFRAARMAPAEAMRREV